MAESKEDASPGLEQSWEGEPSARGWQERTGSREGLACCVQGAGLYFAGGGEPWKRFELRRGVMG